MKKLNETLIRREVDKNKSSLLYRKDLSNANYHLEFPINHNHSINKIKYDFTQDLEKITLSVINHTGGIRELSDEDKKDVELDYNSMVDDYGKYIIPFYVIYPSGMEVPDVKDMVTTYNLLIPGRPIIKTTSRYTSKIVNVISENEALIRRRYISKKIIDGLVFYGLDKITSIDLYVYDYSDTFSVICVFSFTDDGEELLNKRKKNKEYSKIINDAIEQKIKDDNERLRREREEYFKRKEEFINAHSSDGPSGYYAEKEFLRRYGDSRFESPSSLRNSNFTGD